MEQDSVMLRKLSQKKRKINVVSLMGYKAAGNYPNLNKANPLALIRSLRRWRMAGKGLQAAVEDLSILRGWTRHPQNQELCPHRNPRLYSYLSGPVSMK